MMIFLLLCLPFVHGQVDPTISTVSNNSDTPGIGLNFQIHLNRTSFYEDVQLNLKKFLDHVEEKKDVWGERFNAVKSLVMKTSELVANTSKFIFKNETSEFCFDIPSIQEKGTKKACVQFKVMKKLLAIRVAVSISSSNSSLRLYRTISPMVSRPICLRNFKEFSLCLKPFETFVNAVQKRFKICFELKVKSSNENLLGINLNCFDIDDKRVSLVKSETKVENNLVNLNVDKLFDLKSKIRLSTDNTISRKTKTKTFGDDIMEGLDKSKNDLDFYTKEIGWKFEAVKDYVIELAHYLLLSEYSIHVKKTMFCIDVPLKQDIFAENFSLVCSTFTLDKKGFGIHTEMAYDSKIRAERTISAMNDSSERLCSRIPGFEEVSLCIKRTKSSISKDKKSFEMCLEMGITSSNINLIGINLNCYTLENGRDFYIKANNEKPCKYLINLDGGKLNGKLVRNKKIKLFTVTPGPARKRSEIAS